MPGSVVPYTMGGCVQPNGDWYVYWEDGTNQPLIAWAFMVGGDVWHVCPVTETVCIDPDNPPQPYTLHRVVKK
jgi:hypothetical protein